MIILYDPSNDRLGFFVAQLVFSTYLSVSLFERGRNKKFGTSLEKSALLEFYRLIFKYKPNHTFTLRSVKALI